MKAQIKMEANSYDIFFCFIHTPLLIIKQLNLSLLFRGIETTLLSKHILFE